MKRAIAAAVLLSVCSGQGTAAPAQNVKPMRIMSLKECTDALLLDLVPTWRIASLDYLSQEPAALKLWPKARGLPVNHNTAEEIVAQRPDLIVTDTFMSPAMRALVVKSGARMVEVPPPENFAAIRDATRQVAAAVGEQARGEALIADMDARLGALAATRPARAVRVAAWGGGGYVPGRGSLFDAILKEAGATNIVTGTDGYYDVESLLAARPDILAYGDEYNDTPSLRADQDGHPALLKFYAHRRITYPSRLYGCGVPESAAAAVRLRATLKAVMRQRGGVP